MQREDEKRMLELAGYRLDIAKEDLQVAIENMAANHLRAANTMNFTLYQKKKLKIRLIAQRCY